MKIAFSTRALDLYPHRYGEAPPELRGRLLRWGAAKGFDGLEIEDKWASVETMDDGELDRFRAQAADAGLTLTLKLHSRDVATAPAAEQHEAGVRRAIACAATLGAPVVSVSLPTLEPVRAEVSRRLGREWRPSSRDALPDSYETAAAALRRLGRFAAEQGVALSVEMHQGSIVDTGASLLHLLEQVDLPSVGANPDLANLMQLEPPPDEDWRICLERLAARTNHWHVKNIRRYVVGGAPLLHRRDLDEGFVDYRWCVAHLLAHGFDGFAVVEGSGYGDHLTLVETGAAYLRRLIEERRAFGV